MKNVPKRIYLQITDTHESDDFNDHDDITWCVDRINDTDISYIVESEDKSKDAGSRNFKEIINKTGKEVKVVDNNGNLITSFPTKGYTFCELILTKKIGEYKPIENVYSVPINRPIYSLSDLPEQVDGIYYIVNQGVKCVHPNRTDLLVPMEVTLDNKHYIICRALST